MLISEPLPFVKEFIDALDEALKAHRLLFSEFFHRPFLERLISGFEERL